MKEKIQKLRAVVEKGLYAENLQSGIHLIEDLAKGDEDLSLPLFTLIAVFTSLLDEWGDGQGIKSEDYERLNSIYQKPCLEILDAMLKGQNQQTIEKCQKLAATFFSN